MPQSNSSRLYVGGICKLTSKERLKEYFEKFGEITYVNIMTNEFGESRGFGFVDVKGEEAVAKILQKIHILDLKQLDIKRARAPLDWGDKKNLTTRWGTGNITVRVDSLHQDTTEEEIRAKLSSYGTIESVRMMTDDDSTKKLCYVDFTELMEPGRLYTDSVFVHRRRVQITASNPKRNKTMSKSYRKS
jgi:RNA recognition motif-containing protein